MDHIPLPPGSNDASHYRFECQFSASEIGKDVVGGEHLDDFDLIVKAAESLDALNENLKLIQRVQYFDPLKAFYEIMGFEGDYRADMYISTDGQGVRLDTRALRMHLVPLVSKRWQRDPRPEEDEGEVQTVVIRLVDFFRRLHQHVESVDALHHCIWTIHGDALLATQFSRLLLCTATVIEALLSISASALDIPMGNMPDINIDRLTALFSQCHISRHWCAWITQDIGSSPTLLYYISMLPSHSVGSHSGCSPTACVESGDYTREIHYKTCLDSTCDLAAVNPSELRQSLGESRIPVVSRDRTVSGWYALRNHDAGPYVAVSHVWSHGLGNERDNKMPSSQLARIQEQAKQIIPEAESVWIDTLCVPVRPEDDDYRRMAVQMMAKTYREASAVLVLDRQLEHGGDDILEQKVRLMLSAWITRLWTLQEAVLPGPEKVYVQFRTRAVCLARLLQPLAHDIVLHRGIGVQIELRMQWKFCGYHYQSHEFAFSGSILGQPLRPLRELLIALQTLRTRTTTKDRDTPVCLATLLGIDLDLKRDLSLTDILSRYPVLPSALAFYPGPREATPGFQWAPATVLNASVALNLADNLTLRESYGERLPDGLRIYKPVVQIEDLVTIQHYGPQSFFFMLRTSFPGKVEAEYMAHFRGSYGGAGDLIRPVLIFQSDPEDSFFHWSVILASTRATLDGLSCTWQAKGKLVTLSSALSWQLGLFQQDFPRHAGLFHGYRYLVLE